MLLTGGLKNVASESGILIKILQVIYVGISYLDYLGHRYYDRTML